MVRTQILEPLHAGVRLPEFFGTGVSSVEVQLSSNIRTGQGHAPPMMIVMTVKLGNVAIIHSRDSGEARPSPCVKRSCCTKGEVSNIFTKGALNAIIPF